jgi:LPXTG-motif cell wall-anchored protein
LLPTPVSTALVPEGLAIIEVGPSRAAATANGTDRAVPDAAASIARITLLPGVLDGLPGLDPGAIEELPLDDILDLLPPEVTDLLPVDDLLGALASEDPSDEPTDPATDQATDEATDPATEDESGNPIEDQFGDFMQADEGSMGFVIDLETGTEPVCILEDTPLETCVTLGGTSETFTEDGLGVGVLAAGVELSLIRGAGEFAPAETSDNGARRVAKAEVAQGEVAQAPGPGLVELIVGRSEAGVAAAFVQAPAPTTTPSATPLPQTGGATSTALPALLLMGLSGVALFGLRRRG